MLTNLYTTIIFLVLAVFLERNLGQGRLEALRTTRHDRTHVTKTEAAKTFESDGKQGKQMNRVEKLLIVIKSLFVPLDFFKSTQHHSVS